MTDKTYPLKPNEMTAIGVGGILHNISNAERLMVEVRFTGATTATSVSVRGGIGRDKDDIKTKRLFPAYSLTAEDVSDGIALIRVNAVDVDWIETEVVTIDGGATLNFAHKEIH